MSKLRTQQSPSLAADTHSGSESVARILAVAETLFAEHGFDAISINTIAERAGVSKANVFHHFTSKHELYVAVLRNASEQCAEHLQTFEAQNSTFAQRYTAFASQMLANMLERESLHRLMLRELLTETDGRLAKELAERVFGDRFARLVAVLRAGQTRGELRADFDPAIAAMVLIGANVFFLQMRNVFKHLPDARLASDSQRYSALLADVLWHGIAATTEHNKP